MKYCWGGQGWNLTFFMSRLTVQRDLKTQITTATTVIRTKKRSNSWTPVLCSASTWRLGRAQSVLVLVLVVNRLGKSLDVGCSVLSLGKVLYSCQDSEWTPLLHHYGRVPSNFKTRMPMCSVGWGTRGGYIRATSTSTGDRILRCIYICSFVYLAGETLWVFFLPDLGTLIYLTHVESIF